VLIASFIYRDIERGRRNITLRSIDKLAKGVDFSNADLLAELSQQRLQRRPRRATFARKLANILLVQDDPNAAALTLRALGSTRIVNQIQVVSDGAGALEYVLRTGRYAEPPRAQPSSCNPAGFEFAKGDRSVAAAKTGPAHTKAPGNCESAPRGQALSFTESRRLGVAACLVKPVGFGHFIQAMSQLGLPWGLLAPTADVNGVNSTHFPADAKHSSRAQRGKAQWAK